MSSGGDELLIVAMGPSQLLAAIASAQQTGLSLKGALVAYRGVTSDGLEEVMQRLCLSWGMTWWGILTGNFFMPSRGGLNGAIDLWRARLAPEQYLRRRLGWRADPVYGLCGKTVMISLRHAQTDDAFLLAALKPTTVIYTADGVIVGEPAKRYFGPAERAIVGRYGAPYPLPAPIFSPEYLAEHASKVGKATLLDRRILDDVFARASRAMDSAEPFDHVVLSQHLALSKLTTEMEEMRVWKDVFRFTARRHPDAAILLKPHPRDRRMKLSMLREQLGGDVRVVEPAAQMRAQPLETMALAKGAWVYGLSSSALLFASRHAGHNVAVLNSRNWPDELSAEINQFVKETGLPMFWLDEAGVSAAPASA